MKTFLVLVNPCPTDEFAIDCRFGVTAFDLESAAERAAELDDSQSAEWGIAGGEPAVVYVWPEELVGPPQRFVVHAESTPTYFAYPANGRVVEAE